jgi:hypothetical protein
MKPGLRRRPREVVSTNSAYDITGRRSTNGDLGSVAIHPDEKSLFIHIGRYFAIQTWASTRTPKYGSGP